MTLSRIVAAVVVVLGAVAFASFGPQVSPRWTAEGPGWRASRVDGTTLSVAAGTTGVTLTDGTRLEIDGSREPCTIALDVRLASSDAILAIQVDGDDRVVTLSAEASLALLVSEARHRPRPLDTRDLVLGDDRRIDVAVTLERERALVTIDGGPPLRWPRSASDPSPPLLALTAPRGSAIADRMSISQAGADARVVELTARAPAYRPSPRVLRVGAAALAVVWLVALARLAGLGRAAAWTAAVFTVAPLGAAWTWAGVTRRAPSELVTATAIAAGLALAAWAGRRVCVSSSPSARVTRWPGIVALVLVLVVVASVRHAWTTSRAAVERTAAARAVDVAAGTSAPRHLDASNALVFEGPYRNATITFTATLTEGSALLVRTRADDVDLPVGTSFLLSTSDRRRGGWIIETPADRVPRNGATARLAPDREHTVELRLQERTSTAFVDGQLAARLVSDTHVAGGVVFVTAPGVATVGDVRIEPTPEVSDAEPRASWMLSVAVVAGLTVSVAGAWVVLRRTTAPVPITEAAALAGLVLLPLAAALVDAPRDPHVGLVARGSTLAVAGFTLTAIWARVRALPLVVAVLVIGAATPVALHVALEPRPDTEGMSLNAMRYTSWRGDRLHDELLYLEHPLHRRYDFYLARHAFRGRTFEIPKPAGTQRVAAIGGSSTWGYGLDASDAWPARLEERLGAHAEVMNVGIQAGTGPRLVRLLRDVVLPFEPDVVVVSLTFNDAFAHSRGDEEEYLRRVTSPTYRRSWWRDILDRHAEERGLRAMRDLATAFARAAPDATTLDVWRRSGAEPPSPPERFERVLQDFVDLCAAHDVGLVFVQEPVRDDARRLWKDEFHDVMADVGARHDVPVVDPWPALADAGADGTPMFLDGIHPTAAGCRVMAATVAPAVRDALEPR